MKALKGFVCITVCFLPMIYGVNHVLQTDISLEKTLPTKNGQRIFLISYAYGEAHKRNQNYLIASAINKGIDTIIAYRKEHIDKEFYEKYRHILDGDWGGWYLWKSYFILKTLKEVMAENDILIYSDAGQSFINPIQPLVDMVNDPSIDVILFENQHTNRRHVKRDTFDIMGVDYKHRDTMQLEGGELVIRKTDHSISFISKWLEYCCIEQAITGAPSIAQEFDDLESHRSDQSILSLLSIKYPERVKIIEKYGLNIFWLHRRRDENISMKEFEQKWGLA